MIARTEVNIERALAIPGWMSDVELRWLAEQAAECKGTPRLGGTIIEIGSWLGRSTRAIAENTESMVWAVDTWKGTTGEAEHRELIEKMSESLLEGFHRNMAGLENVFVLQMTSLDAALSCKTRGIDMVFIDADHSYSAVFADILAWRPFLRQGGLLCGHDYYWGDVKRAVDELIPDRWLVPNATIWYTRV